MRRYLQGTLDFDCALYAVVNALACIHDIDLGSARHLYQESLLSLSACPRLWEAYLRNETDFYWLVKHLLSRWCCDGPWRLRVHQPFGSCLLPAPRCADAVTLADAPLYLPERMGYAGDASALVPHPLRVWEALSAWLGSGSAVRAAIFRFHRFMPGSAIPVVSHWTTGTRVCDGELFLHDASGEKESLHSLEKACIVEQPNPMIRIAPESIALLERGAPRPL